MNNVNFNLQNILHSSHSIIFFNISFPVITFYKTKITIYIMKPLTFTIFLKGNNNIIEEIQTRTFFCHSFATLDDINRSLATVDKVYQTKVININTRTTDVSDVASNKVSSRKPTNLPTRKKLLVADFVRLRRGEQRFPRTDKETLYCNLRNSAVHVLLCGNRFLYRLQPRTRPCPGFILLLFLFLSLSRLKYRQIEKRRPISREVEKFIMA